VPLPVGIWPRSHLGEYPKGRPLIVAQWASCAHDRGHYILGSFGTTKYMLGMKCTPHFCRLASWNTVPIAFFNPEWGSEMTSFTPSKPQTFSDRKNAVQNPSFSVSPTSKLSTSQRPSAATPATPSIASETVW
jgi:hypothetical protein